MNNNLEKESWRDTRPESGLQETDPPRDSEAEIIVDIAPDEFVEIKLDDLEDLSDFIVEEGEKETTEIEETSGLSEAEIQEAKKKLNFSERMKNIYSRVRDLMQQARESVMGILKHQTQAGKIFNPEKELEKLKKLPSIDRRKALGEFKERLAFQKRGIAEMQEAIIAEIRKDPDASIENLYAKIGEYSKKFRLSEEQKGIAEAVILDYKTKRMKIKELRKKYPNDADLFKILFGREPKGRIEIVQGPATLFFKCYDPDDFTYIDSNAFLEGRDVTEEDSLVASRHAGIHVLYSLEFGTEDAINALNMKIIQERNMDAESAIIHEEQHSIKKFFQEKFLKIDMNRALKEIKDESLRDLALRRIFRDIRDTALYFDESAKDEILAFFSEGRSQAKIIELLTKPKAEGGVYDYLDRNELKKPFERMIKGITKDSGLDSSSEDKIREIADEIFKTEYHELINDGVIAMWSLWAHGYSKDQVIAVLLQEPLSNWKRAVSRLLKTKTGKA